MGTLSTLFKKSFLLELDPDQSTPLRQAMSNAITSSGCSLTTARNLVRELKNGGYVEHTKAGRSYQTTITPPGVELLQQMIEGNEGLTPTVEEGYQIPDDGLVLNARVEKKDWSALMRQVNQRKLMTAFLPRGVDVFVQAEDGEYVKVPTIA